MTSNASWRWTSEWGRDQMLRDELESQAAHASRTSSRLRSQLTQVQGSMDRRIGALARAFDAYVELGDVREELASMPSSAPVRRRARDAMASLRAGQTPVELPEGQAGHWLGGAMNRVLAVFNERIARNLTSAATGGGSVGRDTERVLAGSPDARVFEAVTLAVLGHGEHAVDRLPDLLTTDGGFTLEQQVIFHAAVDGHFGPTALQVIGPAVTPHLARDQRSNWDAWLTEQAGAGDVSALRWVIDRTTPSMMLPELSEGANPVEVDAYNPGGTAAQAAPMDSRTTMEHLVNEMIGEGAPVERELIRRASILRARIEKPDATSPPARWEIDSDPVVTIVRQSFERLPVSSPQHAEMLHWILPQVRPRIDELLAATPAVDPITVAARTSGVEVQVTDGGPDSGQLRSARDTIETRYARPPISRGLAIGAVIAVVLGVGGSVASSSPVLAIVGLAVAAGLIGRLLWLIRPGDRRLQREADLKALETTVEKTEARVDAAVVARDELRRERQRLVDLARDRLEAIESVSTESR